MSVSMPSRRNLVAAGAWAVPAVTVASAAPAYAATEPCAEGEYTIDWARHYNATRRQAVAELGALGSGSNGGTSLTMTVQSQFFGGRMRGATAGDGASNMTVSPFNVGGLGRRGLTLLQDAGRNDSLGSNSSARRTHRQEVTFSFSRPVTNLTFTITDIDAQTTDGIYWHRQYLDRVEASAGYAATTPSGSVVTGAGTQSAPWHNPTTDQYGENTDIVHPQTGNRGNITLTYPNASSVTITFWNNQSSTLVNRGAQGIFISPLTFSASTCAP